MLRRGLTYLCMGIFALTLSACSETQYAAHLAKEVINTSDSQGSFKVGKPYRIAGKIYHPRESYRLVETGVASWYGPQFHGKKTANGEIFNKYDLTAAHRTLQLPSIIRVTNLDNGRSAILGRFRKAACWMFPSMGPKSLGSSQMERRVSV